MQRYYFTDWNDDKPVALHVVTMPTFGEPGFYRAVVSADTFFMRECKRLSAAFDRARAGKGPNYVKRRMSMRYERDVKELAKLDIQLIDKKLPTFEHNSLWEFYKAVGYDYKKRRYV